MLIQEALHEAKISSIAEEIRRRGNVKFVMIAGPSSSGKTSFSHRLSIQLSAHGLKPHPIAVDNYFVDREHTPLDEFGEKNYECLEAIDTKQFNEDMLNLLSGKLWIFLHLISRPDAGNTEETSFSLEKMISWLSKAFTGLMTN